MHERPAILGGKPAFRELIDIVRPGLPPLEKLRDAFSEVLENGKITNNSRFVRRFEQVISEHVDTPAAAVANGTLGLMLLLKALGRGGEVVMPSFTFPATAHAARWCGMAVRFADIDPETWNLSPEAAARACGPDTVAIMGVHVFGVPCDVDALSEVARRAGVPLLFDAAHAFGATYRGRAVGGLGQGEVFSFHATKILGVGEGGAVTTADPAWLDLVKAGRNFGLDKSGDCADAGLNAKMSELFAIIGLTVLETFTERLAQRRRVGVLLRERIGKLAGLTLQRIPESCESTHQNFAVLVDATAFGLARDELHAAMTAENVMTRKYFHPALHTMSCYRGEAAQDDLAETERVAERVLCFPIYSDMTDLEVNILVGALERIHADRGAVRARLREKR
ncbi:MAG: DegT/DnrJ/EryC1/StrS family aminotransferase [Deltaproteobacteria bacterium]|nr:DegT/DnrJ/EryC1/StrS family aminotransferase [Deltaproteobacteria bacterium]